MRVDWAMRLGGPDTDTVWDIATLPDGSTLIAGTFIDEMTYGEGSPDRGEIIPAGAFVICISANGSIAWSLHSGGTGDVEGWALDVFSDRHFYVFGRYWGTVIFGLGESTETQLNDSGSYVAKYDLEGKLIWARRIGNLPVEVLAEESISVADDGSFMIAGGYGGEVTFGLGETNETTLTRYGGFDIFVAKYDSTGDLVWATRAGGPTPTGDWGESDCGTDIQVLPDGSSIMTGYFFNSAIFGEGELNETTLYPISAHDDEIFLAKYNQEGTLAWAKSLGAGIGSFRFFGGFPRIDLLSDSSIFISCSFSDTAAFGDNDPPDTVLTSPDSESAFLAHYENDGSFVWAIKVGENSRSMDISTMSDDTVVMTGAYYDSTTLGLGEPSETTFPFEDFESRGDVFVANYNKEGHLIWAQRGVGDSWDKGISIETTNDGNIIISGQFQEDICFCNARGGEAKLEANGYDAFIVKLSEVYIGE